MHVCAVKYDLGHALGVTHIRKPACRDELYDPALWTCFAGYEPRKKGEHRARD